MFSETSDEEIERNRDSEIDVEHEEDERDEWPKEEDSDDPRQEDQIGEHNTTEEDDASEDSEADENLGGETDGDSEAESSALTSSIQPPLASPHRVTYTYETSHNIATLLTKPAHSSSANRKPFSEHLKLTSHLVALR